MAFSLTPGLWGKAQPGREGQGLTEPPLCGVGKCTLGMNSTGCVSRSLSGRRNVISFPLKPESKQPFRPTDGESSSAQLGVLAEGSPSQGSQRSAGNRTGPAAPPGEPRTIPRGWRVLTKGFGRLGRSPARAWLLPKGAVIHGG